jgi:hypothetical protein
MDYIGNSTVNAFAFYFEDWYFIGITEGMLDLFAKSCTALWRLNLLSCVLGVELSVRSAGIYASDGNGTLRKLLPQSTNPV